MTRIKNGQQLSTEPAPAAELSPAQLTAIFALVTGLSQAEAAPLARVSEETISRWKREPAFIAELNARKLARYEEMTAKIDSLGEKAVKALGELLESQNTRTRLDALKLYFSVQANLRPPDLPTDAAALELQQRKAQASYRRESLFIDL